MLLNAIKLLYTNRDNDSKIAMSDQKSFFCKKQGRIDEIYDIGNVEQKYCGHEISKATIRCIERLSVQGMLIKTQFFIQTRVCHTRRLLLTLSLYLSPVLKYLTVILMTLNQRSSMLSKIKSHGANRKPIDGFIYDRHCVQHCIFHGIRDISCESSVT